MTDHERIVLLELKLKQLKKDQIMTLDDGDKAEIKEFAREIVKEVLLEHVDSCPYGKRMTKLIAMCIGVGIGAGVGTSVISKLLMAL